MSPAFAPKLPRSTKRDRGRTPARETPIAIRGVAIPVQLERRIRGKLARQLGHAGPMIERGTVRFEDLNGPRGGVDSECRIKLVLSGRPSVQVSQRASDPEGAFDLAAHKARRALESVRGKHTMSSRRRFRDKGANVARARAAAAELEPVNPRARPHEKIKTSKLPPARRAAKSRARAVKRAAATRTTRSRTRRSR